jgi:TetR/AcrR family transcriptional regulator, transcriptional repressor for nem operon
LFHKQGIRATSPDEIIEAAGIGKGQFYHYFKNKEGLVHEVLQWHFEAIKAGTSIIDYDIKSWKDLEAWFRAHIELQKGFGMTRGCPFGTAANDVGEEDEIVRLDLVQIFGTIEDRLAHFFRSEKAHGRLNRSADEQHLADFCISTLQGAMLIGKVRRDPEFAEAAARETLKYLRSYELT